MAADVVSVRNSLIEKLDKYAKASQKGKSGLLLGVKDGDRVCIVGAAMLPDGQLKNLAKGIKQVKDVTSGLSVVGVWFKMAQGHLAVIVRQVWDRIKPKEVLQDCFEDDRILVLPVGAVEILENQMVLVNSKDGPSVYTCNNMDEKLVETPVEVSNDSVQDSNILVRLQAQVTLGFDFSTKKERLKENIQQAVEGLQDKLSSELVTFHVKDSAVLLEQDSVVPASLESSTPCSHLLEWINADQTVLTEKKSSKKGAKHCQSVIHIELLMQVSGEKAAENGISCAPIIHHDHGEFQYASVPLGLDVAIAVDSRTPVGELHKLLSEGTVRQLGLLGENVWNYAKQDKVRTPRVYHFRPWCLDHLVTVIYPDGLEEDHLESFRRKLHNVLMMPMDRPMLRRAMAYEFPDEVPPDGYLRNPHVGLPPTGVTGGRTYIVHGTYSYHHYMQDRVDDNKWGCAYRSLQTLVSWFRHQGYTEKPVPTHAQIQQALVDVGDKSPKFVGSKQWIGSTEVSYVLDHMFGVSSKILFVSSGAEMASKGRELAIHFETQGTPVMIGGGVLAHTILGVDFNEVTGNLKFLILDPHYTGAEDLSVVQDKGWCGWKGPDFWDQTAYYNMCMPQRPAMI